MAYDVFISHSSKDKTVADATCAFLESKGIRCWIAPRDIRPGANYGGAILKAIREARVMVLIFSSHANASVQITREVERAINAGATVIPFRIEDVLPKDDLDYFLSTPHWLDAFTPPLERHLERLAVVIPEVLEMSAPAPVMPDKKEVESPPAHEILETSIPAADQVEREVLPPPSSIPEAPPTQPEVKKSVDRTVLGSPVATLAYLAFVFLLCYVIMVFKAALH
jgi:hypothetical protein